MEMRTLRQLSFSMDGYFYAAQLSRNCQLFVAVGLRCIRQKDTRAYARRLSKNTMNCDQLALVRRRKSD